MLLKDKVVIVSGIGPGMGVKLAVLCAKEGAKLAICARTPAKLDDAEQQISALGLGTELIKVPCDISDRAQCDALAEKTLEAFGRIDVLMNSAFIPGEFTAVDQASMDDWRATMDVNLMGTMNLSQAVVPAMKAQQSGAIIMVNSMVTRKMLPYQSGYAASKAALTSAAKSLAVELGPFGIRVNTCYMGWMWGPSVEGFMQSVEAQQGVSIEAQKAEIAKSIPLGRIPEDGECAKACVMLASDYASAITGGMLDVNGGEFIAL
jgi:NAD(P)-dependent dehydrogenase (short-subunit alcohol dehydrogenase family)